MKDSATSKLSGSKLHGHMFGISISNATENIISYFDFTVIQKGKKIEGIEDFTKYTRIKNGLSIREVAPINMI